MEILTDNNQNDPMGGAPAPAGSKLGMIGIVLGILGLIVYCGPLAIAFILGATGNAPDAGSPSLVVLSLASYCGVFFSIAGAVLGGISLARGENKTFGIISIVLGVLILCTCSVLALVGVAISM